MQIFVSIMIQDDPCTPWSDHINSRTSPDLTIDNNDAEMAKRFSQSRPPPQAFLWDINSKPTAGTMQRGIRACRSIGLKMWIDLS